jgi:hypothetical protein
LCRVLAGRHHDHGQKGINIATFWPRSWSQSHPHEPAGHHAHQDATRWTRQAALAGGGGPGRGEAGRAGGRLAGAAEAAFGVDDLAGDPGGLVGG